MGVQKWLTLEDGEWFPNSTIHVWLPEKVREGWKKSRADALQNPVIEFLGSSLWASKIDGMYDFVPTEGEACDPPVFRHQVCRDLWLYLGTDWRWWVSNTEDM